MKKILNGTMMILMFALIFLETSCKNSTASDAKSLTSNDNAVYRLGNRYGESYGDHYMDDIQPILAKRCVACHSCTNAPCQLNMTSYKALERGLTKLNPYAVSVAKKPDTRIINNWPTERWRKMNFFSVLPGEEPGRPPEDSIIYRNIWRGRTNLAANMSFNESEIRRMVKAHVRSEFECPVNSKEYDAFEAKYPQGGMPCALPALPDSERQVLLDWIKSGAPGPSAAAQKMASMPRATAKSKGDPQAMIAAWEKFLNPDSLSGQLVGRYIYEHSFIANIHLAENPGEFYRIVRSSTAYPGNIEQIYTEAPQDDPQIQGRVFYRMQKVDRVIEAKTHVAWPLSMADIDNFNSMFKPDTWSITQLPGYTSGNPFEVFEAIPVRARAQFLLENARMIMQSKGRGPICFEQGATYEADEYFFYFFLDPDSDPSVLEPKLGLSTWDDFYKRDLNWKSVPQFGMEFGEGRYREAFEATLRKLKPTGLGIDDIWTGSKNRPNPNALVVGRRHQYHYEFDYSGTRILTGLPRSAELMSYAGIERSYYNVVAQYKYYEGAMHKLMSWDWEAYGRTEGEDLFVSLFSNQSYRNQLRERYTGPKGRFYYWLYRDYAAGRPAAAPANYDDGAMLKAILAKLGGNIIGDPDRLNNWPDSSLPKGIATQIKSIDDWEAGLRSLTARKTPYAQLIPNVIYVRIDGTQLYTLYANRGYTPDKLTLLEAQSRDRTKDMMMAYKGLLGIAPELFIDLRLSDAADFLSKLAQVTTVDGWESLAAKYKIGRNSEKFWPFVDWISAWQHEHMPIEAGILELRFYDQGGRPY